MKRFSAGARVRGGASHPRRRRDPSVFRGPRRRPSRSSPATTGNGGWRVQPELATRVGRADHNDHWRDLVESRRAIVSASDREEFLQKAMYLSPGNLNPTDLVTSLLMEHELRTQLEAQDYLNLVQLMSQSDGAHNEVFNVIDQMPSRTVKDYENIITRLRALPTLHRSDDRADARAARRRPRAAGDRRRSDARPGDGAEQAGGRASRRCWPRFAVPGADPARPNRSGCARRRARRTTSSSSPAGRDSRRSCATPIVRRRGRRPR